jgi:hypothetical protein
MRDGARRAVTRATRIALTSLCLATVLLTTRNAFRRTQSPAERGPRIDAPRPGDPREIRNFAHPFARGDSATARQRCLGSARARLAVYTGLSAPRDQRARDASGRRLQSTCQRRAPDEPRGVRICSRLLDSLRRTVPARGDRPLRPEFRRPSRSVIPARACHGTRSSDVSVTFRDLASLTSLEPVGQGRFYRHSTC